MRKRSTLAKQLIIEMNKKDAHRALESRLRTVINQFPGLLPSEKVALRKKLMKTDPSDWERVCKEVNKATKKINGRRNRNYIREVRESGTGNVFFLCTTVRDPAPDHKPYQGALYVDRYWRNTLTEFGASGKVLNAIASYIRNHQIKTVQEIMGEPVYMTTRPYCRHQFIAVSTYDVMMNSLGKVKKQTLGALTTRTNAAEEREMVMRTVAKVIGKEKIPVRV